MILSSFPVLCADRINRTKGGCVNFNCGGGGGALLRLASALGPTCGLALLSLLRMELALVSGRMAAAKVIIAEALNFMIGPAKGFYCCKECGVS
jgi:hypothetical protein